MGEVTEQAVNEAAAKSSSKMVQIVYILYLASIVLGITQLIGVIIAYVNKGDAPDWAKTHYQYQIRTFWMGILYFMIAGITIYLLVGFVLIFVVLIWFVIRCVKGLKYHSRSEPIPNPTSWLL